MDEAKGQFYPAPPALLAGMWAFAKDGDPAAAVVEPAEPQRWSGHQRTQATRSLVLPAMWKDYLIYGNSDALGMSGQAEIDLINLLEGWLEAEGLDRCLQSHGAPEFSWSNDGPIQTPCNCVTYTFTLK